MVAISPFRALRYNPDLVGELGGVLAPPYDLIGPEEREQLSRASPYNVVRLTLGRPDADEPDAAHRYARAQREFAAWCQKRVLRQDPVPAIYLTEQTFTPPPGTRPMAGSLRDPGRRSRPAPGGGVTDHGARRSRLGFIAALGLDASSERAVYRHESTLAEPRQDRARLLEALPANLEPIFCLFPDAGGKVQARLQDLAGRSAPTAEARFHDETIRLWALTEPRVIQELAQRLVPAAVLIADGHHRFEAAYAQRDRYSALMAYFVSMSDPALIVRPIHRVFQHEGDADVQGLRGMCRLEPAADLDGLLAWLQDDGGAKIPGGPAARAPDEVGRFGYADGRALYQVTVDPDRLARWLSAPPVPPPLARLDVSLLHELILPSLMPNWRTSRCTYTADASEALRAVERGAGRSAWLLRAIPLGEIYGLAAQGLALPPKSTYFYPKVPSGLTINPLA